MKLKLKTEAGRRKPAVSSPVAGFRPASSERGIALVITLIMLSVTLVMAIAFLAISRRERGSVTTSTDIATARLAADAALANAQAQIIASILATSNAYHSSLIVSTNYLGQSTGNPLLDLTLLQVSPRAPVYVPSPPDDYIAPTNYDIRFYLDLNRNGSFESNGLVADVDSTGATNGNFSVEVGDPEWIGVLERPDVPHGPDNQFVSRYAFIAVPADGALDLNAIHNETALEQVNPAANGMDSFLRNQGVGSWEINLAAYLADINTNQWDNVSTQPYQYNEPVAYNTGYAFEDALSLLSYRYATNYASLAPIGASFANASSLENATVNLDLFPFGPLMTNNPPVLYYVNNLNSSWPGSDNTNQYFSILSDLFDPTKTSVEFTNRLISISTNVDTYDRYTFYRLLGQLGTDSSPEQGKINLNFSNAAAYFDGNGLLTNIVVFPDAETNLVPWQPIQFFTIAADRMLRLYTANWLASNYGSFTNTFGASVTSAFGITKIPVMVNGHFVYSPAVNRLLQLSANIYDATTTNSYPSVFRPLFTVPASGTVYISGYTQETGTFNHGTELASPDLSPPIDVSSLGTGTNMLVNVYGVPWIVGAKKGLPNFNEFMMESSIQVTRKLQFTRDTNAIPTLPASNYQTNQMYIMSFTNSYGLDCWNSYSNNFGSNVVITVWNDSTMTLTNDGGITYSKRTTNALYFALNSWPAEAFVIPLTNADILFTNGVFVYNYPTNHYFGTTTNYLDSGIQPLPQFGLLITNRLQVAIIDYSGGLNSGRIVDYVQLSFFNGGRDLNAEIADQDTVGLWSTNLIGTVPGGVINQYYTSRSGGTVPAEDKQGTWATTPVPGLPSRGGITTLQQAEQAYFTAFFSSQNTAGFDYNGQFYIVTNLLSSIQACYTVTRTAVQLVTWQANDPLVHYLASDLVDPADDTNLQDIVAPLNLGQLNNRYMPWGGNPLHPPNPNTPGDPNTANQWNMALKDPLLESSDGWDFPANQLPTVGWLGRVHRGTPWQTVYLKATDITANNLGTWMNWTGYGDDFDALNSAPVQDRLLFDLFTTAINGNATRGQLSVNVAAGNPDPAAGLAAWSALLSGIAVPPPGPTNTYAVIDPAGAAGVNSPLGMLVTNINATRNLFNNAGGTGGTFERVGDILAATALTEQSPFLNLANTNYNNDELYEWLPQQTLSLLRVSSAPRYVIYSYGQTLKPAPNGVVTGSGNAAFFGMVTNYQVVAETATRAVVQVNAVVSTNVVTGTVSTNYNTQVVQFNVLPPD
jgi:hypothetical protein